MNFSIKKSLNNFFSLNTNISTMIIMVVFVGLGEKMAERFLPLFILAAGGSTIAVGFLNAMDNLLSALYSFPGGYLSDKIGYKKSLIIFTVVAMFGYLLVIIFRTWEMVIIGSVFFISWTAVSLPAVMSLVAKSVPANKRAMGVTIHSFVRRIPMAAGPLLGGFIISVYGTIDGVIISFSAALILAAISIIIVHFFMKDETKPITKKKISPLKNINKDLRNLLIADIMIRFAEQIPYAFVVVWVVNNLGFDSYQFGILTVIEMIAAMLVYIPVAYFADKYHKKPFILISFIFFTLFPMVIYFSESFSLLIVAFIIRGFKEFGEPTRKSLIIDLSPDDAKAGTFGTYYLIRDVIVLFAAISSAFLWNISPLTNFLTASIFGLAGTLWFLFFGRDLKSVKTS